MSAKPKTLKTALIKDLPVLHWAGKRPLDVVRYFPVQVAKELSNCRRCSPISSSIKYNVIYTSVAMISPEEIKLVTDWINKT